MLTRLKTSTPFLGFWQGGLRDKGSTAFPLSSTTASTGALVRYRLMLSPWGRIRPIWMALSTWRTDGLSRPRYKPSDKLKYPDSGLWSQGIYKRKPLESFVFAHSIIYVLDCPCPLRLSSFSLFCSLCSFQSVFSVSRCCQLGPSINLRYLSALR